MNITKPSNKTINEVFRNLSVGRCESQTLRDLRVAQTRQSQRLTKEQERMRSGLSDLEIELLRLAAAGCSNKEIASRQFWSEVTVKRKMQEIYRKLQVADRAQAVAEAMRMGWI